MKHFYHKYGKHLEYLEIQMHRLPQLSLFLTLSQLVILKTIFQPTKNIHKVK